MPMNPRLLRPLATGFNPRQIAGLVGWWDSTDNATITTDTGVSAWADKAGGYTLTQSTGANQPTISSINGNQAFDYNGSSQLLTSTAPGLADLVDGSSVVPTTIFAVVEPDVADQSAVPVSWRSTSVGFVLYGSLMPLTGSVWRTIYRSNDGTAVFISSTDTYTTQPYVTSTTTGADIVGRVNGAEVIDTPNTAAALPLSSNSFAVGALSTPSAFLDGKIGDVLIYNRVLSASEVARVERWLAGKFGITLA